MARHHPSHLRHLGRSPRADGSGVVTIPQALTRRPRAFPQKATKPRFPLPIDRHKLRFRRTLEGYPGANRHRRALVRRSLWLREGIRTASPPRERVGLFGGTGSAAEAKPPVSKASCILRGTEGSNPASSSGESGTNSVIGLKRGASDG